MGFQVYCNNKGCRKDQEPLLDLQTNEVHCSECGKIISTITRFAKTQMKALGQIKRDSDSRESFSVKCKFCNKSSRPSMCEDKISCSLCNEHLDYLSKSYIQAFSAFFGKK